MQLCGRICLAEVWAPSTTKKNKRDLLLRVCVSSGVAGHLYSKCALISMKILVFAKWACQQPT